MENKLQIDENCLNCALSTFETYNNCSDGASTVSKMDECLQGYVNGLNACTP
ncbi:MAG: hypothetical protein VX252_11600 [Myxococcota bacterium]|nr:hypothetical protein [Myxococcota bacterium]